MAAVLWSWTFTVPPATEVTNLQLLDHVARDSGHEGETGMTTEFPVVSVTGYATGGSSSNCDPAVARRR